MLICETATATRLRADSDAGSQDDTADDTTIAMVAIVASRPS